MKLRTMLMAAAGTAIAVTAIMEAKIASAQETQFFPMLTYRTGPFAPNGIPIANGFRDYYKLINARDGGINGVKIAWEECETKYNTKRRNELRRKRRYVPLHSGCERPIGHHDCSH